MERQFTANEIDAEIMRQLGMPELRREHQPPELRIPGVHVEIQTDGHWHTVDLGGEG